MKRYIYIIILLGIKLVGAQENDSISVNHRVVDNLFFRQLYEDLTEVPSNFSFYYINDYTASSLYYEYEDGKYKQGAAPETLKNYGIKTNGLYRSKKGLTFFGNFAIEKSYYNNLKWNLSYELPNKGLMPDPHYFIVSKGANWNNQKYDLNGGFLVPFEEKWEWMLEIDYHLFNKYRTDYDPRPKITFNSLGFTSGASFQITNNQFIKFGGGVGYSHISNEVSYSNRNQNIPANYDIYVRWMAGYGSISNTMALSTMRRNKWTKLYLGHTYKNNNWTVMTDLIYKKEKNITYLSNEIKNYNDYSNYFAKFSPETISATILSVYELSQQRHIKFKLTGNRMLANNFWYTKGGKTYAAEQSELNFEVGYLNQLESGANTDVGVFLTLWNVIQNDALSTTYSAYTNLEFGGHLMHSFKVGENLLISPIFKSHFRMNMNSEYKQGNANYLANVAENDYAGLTLQEYYNEVVMPDNELYTHNGLDVSLGTQINFKASERVNTQLSFDLGLNKPVEELYYFQENNPVRYYATAGLTLYY